MLAKHLLSQDRELFTQQQCLSNKVLWSYFSTTCGARVTASCHLPAGWVKAELWSCCCRNLLALTPLDAGCHLWSTLSASWWAWQAACRSRGKVGLGFLHCSQPWPNQAPWSLREAHRVEGYIVGTASSLNALFPGQNKFLMTTIGLQGWNLQPANSSFCSTVSAGQMCLHITIPEHISSECSWAVCWMVAQCAFRFSSNKGKRWGASNTSTANAPMAKASAREKGTNTGVSL